MHIVSQTLRLRRNRQARELHSPWLRLGITIALLLSLGVVAFGMLGIWYYVDLTHNLPSIATLPVFLEPPNGLLLQPTRLYDRAHEKVIYTLENPAAKDRQYLFVADDAPAGALRVSQYLVDATITELDPGFWDHPGFSLAGVTEGAHPTLAQVLVSSLLLDGEPPSVKRSIRERLLASQVTAQYSREKVLEWYLNSAQYGETIFGADVASRVYFGKSASDLSLAEAAMLTALSEKPSVNPLTGSQILAQLQELIIRKMFVRGLVSGDETLRALKEEVQFNDLQAAQSPAPMFTSLVLMQLSSNIPLERIYRGGFDIVTTLDYNLQQQADCAAQVQAARISGIPEQAMTFDGSACEASGLLPTLKDGIGAQPMDLAAEVVIIEPRSGQVLALVGKDGSGSAASNPSPHPAGSILSPFMYLTAFTRGMNPATLLWDIPPESQINVNNPSHVTVAGSSTAYHGPVSLRDALVNDYTGAAGEVLEQVGDANVYLTEKQFGISLSGLPPATGTGLDGLNSQKVSLLENVHAYSVLANQGIMAGESIVKDASANTQTGLSPTSILTVESLDGTVWLDWSNPEVLPVVNRQIAYLTTNVLSDEKSRWSSLGHPNSLEIGRPAAAKLSLTGDTSGSWVVGYIPQLAVGVWMGNSQGEMDEISAEVPAGLWHAVMLYATKEMPVQDFSLPVGISQVQVCNPSGLLVTSLCPSVIQEVFLTGNEPGQVDNLYRKYSINRETGLLATVFTPPEMVETRVFLDVPPQAQAWAEQAGLAIPPESYDAITAALPFNQEVQIITPKMFDHVSGNFIITGSASGEDFSYYRLQVGQGLNPEKWLQIGVDVSSPVSNGILGTWDTAGLEGLYIAQLQVVRTDTRVDQAVLQLTIDNTRPELEILSPLVNEQFNYKTGLSIMMNVSARDNLVLERVEFFIDGQMEATLLESPYVIVWDALPGEHTLQVNAYDLAGNESESSITFNVNR